MTPPPPALESIYSTFSASIRSVGTAVTLAAVGVYLHRRGFVTHDGKRTLALISQQVTFPLFLFTKIIYCNQDWSANPCPDVTKSLADVWILLIWPLYVVTCGVVVGSIIARVTLRKPPSDHHADQLCRRAAVLAACGFGNSTGLPITLLTVVHANFPGTSDLGRIDPTLFLSVYLLLYPVLQWGYGGWLLSGGGGGDEEEASARKKQQESRESDTAVRHESTAPVSSSGESHTYSCALSVEDGNIKRIAAGSSLTDSFRHNVLNNKKINDYYVRHRHGLSSSDEGLYISEVDLHAMFVQAAQPQQQGEGSPLSGGATPTIPEGSLDVVVPPSSPIAAQVNNNNNNMIQATNETHPLLSPNDPMPKASSYRSTTSSSYRDENNNNNKDTTETLWGTVHNIARRCLTQPPVLGAIAGIVCAVTPARGYLVDLVDRDASAPLQWMFDGLYAVGLSAVPLNMMILGCNLSASWQGYHHHQKQQQQKHIDDDDDKKSVLLLPFPTMIGVVIGKMLLMPMIGLVSCWCLKNLVLDIPDDIDGAFYLVMLIVFLTPTANNVMVMIELSGSGAKEAIASVIALQYAVAPVILSLTMTVAIGFASNWS